MSNPARPRTVSPLHDHLGYWLRAVSNAVSARFEAQLAEQGCSVAEWVALRVLYGQPQTSHAALIQALGVTKGAASKILTRLEDKGWVRRALADGQARQQVLALTPAGRTLLPRLAALADANEQHFFGHLGAAERRALAATLHDLAARHGLQTPPLN